MNLQEWMVQFNTKRNDQFDTNEVENKHTTIKNQDHSEAGQVSAECKLLPTATTKHYYNII